MLLWLANMGNAGGGAVVIPPAEVPRDPVAGGTTWSSQRALKQRRIREDDEDFMKIIQEALPEILKYLKL